MSNIVVCPKCQCRLNLPDRYRGQEVQCPYLATNFQAGETAIPTALEVTAAPPLRRDRPDDYGGGMEPPASRRRSVPLDRPKPRRKSPVVWLVGGALVLVTLGVVFLLILSFGKRSPGPRFVENPQEQRRDLEEAFRDWNRNPGDKNQEKPPPVDPQMAEEMQTLFRQVGDALRHRNKISFLAFWDGDRLLEQACGPLRAFLNRNWGSNSNSSAT